MLIKLPIKPLSINAAYRGRRFSTKEHKQYCKDVAMLLPKNQKISGYIEVIYRFYLANWKRTDVFNLEKCLSDVLVSSGIIDDDRFIMRGIVEKYPSKENCIEVEIVEYESAEKPGGTEAEE